MGQTADTIANFSDKLTLISSFVSTGIGLTVLTPLGRIGKYIIWLKLCNVLSYWRSSLWIININSFLVSTQKLSWVYISPISILVILTAILIGMYHNAFPPMNGGAFYFVYFYIFPVLQPLFMTYGPLFLSNADYLTTKYKEFQVQISIGIIIGVYLVISVFSIAYFSNSVLSACVANYEANYEGVTCTMFVWL